MFAVIKTFVTDISASTGRNDFIFDIWLLHGELYRVSLSRFTAHLLERVGVFLARCSIQHLVCLKINIFSFHIFRFPGPSFIVSFGSSTWLLLANIYTFFLFYRNFNILLMRNHMWDWMVEMFLIFSSIFSMKNL